MMHFYIPTDKEKQTERERGEYFPKKSWIFHVVLNISVATLLCVGYSSFVGPKFTIRITSLPTIKIDKGKKHMFYCFLYSKLLH